MNDKQFSEICKKLDKIFAVLAIQSIDDKDSKIYTLKSLGFSSQDMIPIVGIKNVRDTKGWKKK